MVNRVLWRKLRRDLLARKGALLALVAIVAVGVSTFVSMRAVFRDMDGARQRYYDRYRLPHFTVDLKRAPEWTTQLAAAEPNVAAVRSRVEQAVLLDLPGKPMPVPGVALSMPAERRRVLGDIKMRRGAWFSGSHAAEAILSDQFARANGLEPGARIRVRLLDKQHDVLVVGTAMSPEYVYLMAPGGGLAPDPAGYGVLYMPRRFLQESCSLDGAYNQLIGAAHDTSPTALADTLEVLTDRLDAYGVTNTTAVQDQPSVRMLHDELHGVQVTSIIFPTIFLGVANGLRGTAEGAAYFENVVEEMRYKSENGIGTIDDEEYRLVFVGVPCYPIFRRFNEFFSDWKGTFVHSTYLWFASGGTNLGFQYDLKNPIESLAEGLLISVRDAMDSMFHQHKAIMTMLDPYSIDGVVYHPIKSCRTVSTGLADGRKHLMDATNIPSLFLESDMMDQRVVSEAQMKNRVDAFFEGLRSRKQLISIGQD